MNANYSTCQCPRNAGVLLVNDAVALAFNSREPLLPSLDRRRANGLKFATVITCCDRLGVRVADSDVIVHPLVLSARGRLSFAKRQDAGGESTGSALVTW